MAGLEPQTLIVGDGASARNIRYVHESARSDDAPNLFWLSGFMSDMASTKASALAKYAREHRLGCTRFDYSGHGLSGGEFRVGTIGRWLEEARDVFTRATRGKQIVVGSSMGGHIALLLLRALMREAPDEAGRISAMVLIAPAWNMTEELMWKKFPDAVRDEIMREGFHLRPSAYAEPYMITRALIEDGRKHLIGAAPFDPGRPVVILQGALDADVPATHAHKLLELMKGNDVRLVEIADGEHRLSRPEDLDKLYAVIESMTAA